MKGFTKRAILAACVGAAMLITVGWGLIKALNLLN